MHCQICVYANELASAGGCGAGSAAVGVIVVSTFKSHERQAADHPAPILIKPTSPNPAVRDLGRNDCCKSRDNACYKFDVTMGPAKGLCMPLEATPVRGRALSGASHGWGEMGRRERRSRRRRFPPSVPPAPLATAKPLPPRATATPHPHPRAAARRAARAASRRAPTATRSPARAASPASPPRTFSTAP